MLGTIRDDINKILSFIPGASGKLDQLEKYIRGEAEAGALQAVPKIRAEVRDEVKPYVIGAISVGALALIVSMWALYGSRRLSHTPAVAGLLGTRTTRARRRGTRGARGLRRSRRSRRSHA
jgi:hypothetical protein